MNDIVIGKVNDDGGCWGNMAAYPIQHEGKRWLTSEALFQAMRFEDEEIRETIRSQKSPMSAKMKAKKNKSEMVVVPMSDQDLENMMLCLRLKVEQHPELREMLIETGDAYIVENCTNRRTASGLFWGAALIDGYWEGQNWLGVLWMELRAELIASLVS
jgi:N-glycosidase YbiA